MQVAFTLEMKQVFSSPYYPHIDGWIEKVYNFLKTYLQKHVSSKLAWDEAVNIACAAYNFALMSILKRVHFPLCLGEMHKHC